MDSRLRRSDVTMLTTRLEQSAVYVAPAIASCRSSRDQPLQRKVENVERKRPV